MSDVDTERQAVERVYDYMGRKLIHASGNHDAIANLFRPHTVTPYEPGTGMDCLRGAGRQPVVPAPSLRERSGRSG